MHGTVKQSEVNSEFRSLVPIYLELDKDQFVQAGLIAMVGSGSKPITAVVKPPK